MSQILPDTANRAGLEPTGALGSDPSARWSVLYDLWLFEQAAHPLVEMAMTGTGLTADDFGLYLVLGDLGRVTPGDLARITGMRTNTVSAALGRVERRGHITRTPNPNDRRSVFVELSESGQEVLEAAKTGLDVLLVRLEALVDSELVQTAVKQLDAAIRELANLAPRSALQSSRQS